MSPDAQTLALLRQDFALPTHCLSEEELLDWLTARVGEMMRLRPEYLMSLCYTLDLSEDSVNEALRPFGDGDEPPFRRLARLLFGRQCDRARTKRTIDVGSLDDDPNAW